MEEKVNINRTNKMTVNTPYISILTLSDIDRYSPIRKQNGKVD
jgi:hypothetical protein